jgi:glutamyl/glutaminyl-tRNA synthetase
MTIRRPDGSWIFHFVNVIDDLEMKISHVIRGEDHLSNTPKHIELIRALGATPPHYAHIPLILNRDETKMSKRDAGARVADKIAMMAVEVMIARQITYHAARQKDSGKRCDLEAGMAKLLAARVAWANADNAVQIHGGNGFALEFPVSRILCDARILSIFEGAAEIQAQVIARRLLAASN